MPIQPQVIETSSDPVMANEFTFELIGLNLKSPNFNRVEGLARNVETVEHPDAATGLMRKYHGGVIRYEDITIVRVNDQTENDRLMHEFVSDFVATGVKRDGNLVKYRHRKIIRNIEVLGLCASGETLPSYDGATAAPEEISYPMRCDYWDLIF